MPSIKQLLILCAIVIFLPRLGWAQPYRITRDPFDQPGLVLEADPALAATKPLILTNRIKINGIIWDEENPYVILTYKDQRKILGLRDWLEGKQVTQITRDHIVLKTATRSLILEVGKDVSL